MACAEGKAASQLRYTRLRGREHHRGLEINGAVRTVAPATAQECHLPPAICLRHDVTAVPILIEQVSTSGLRCC